MKDKKYTKENYRIRELKQDNGISSCLVERNDEPRESGKWKIISDWISSKDDALEFINKDIFIHPIIDKTFFYNPLSDEFSISIEVKR